MSTRWQRINVHVAVESATTPKIALRLLQRAEAEAKAKHKDRKKRPMEERATSYALIANAQAMIKSPVGIFTRP